MASLRHMRTWSRMFGRIFDALGHQLPPLNFITVHYIYFVGVSLLSAVIFWVSATPARSISFIDALFLTTSAMTLAGLNTVNLSELNTFQQALLFVLMLLGSTIFVSAFVVHVRRKAFESRFKSIIEKARAERRNRRISRPLSSSRLNASHKKAHAMMLGTVIRSPSQGDETRVPQSANSDNTRLREGNEVELCQSNNGVEILDSCDQNQPKDSAPNSTVELDQSLSFDEKLIPPNRRVQTFTDDEARLPSAEVDESSLRDGRISLDENPPLEMAEKTVKRDEHIRFNEGISSRAVSTEQQVSRGHRYPRVLPMQGVGVRRNVSFPPNHGSLSATVSLQSLPQLGRKPTSQYFPSSGFIFKNSQFAGLSDAERERLGGVEYKAIQFLAVLVPLYFVIWQVLGCIAIGAYVASNRSATAEGNGLNPWWLGTFNAVSAFNNNGMSLLDANMVAFQTSVYMLLTMGLLILAGNTCYPIFLRIIVWSFWKLASKNERWTSFRKTLQFLLDHPRRCYTHLFPARHTWWLLMVVFVLNGIDWLAFEVLNIGNDAITALSPGIQVIAGLFQALAVRSGGFYVVPIPTIRISLQVLYVIMMYVSVYPVVITIRNSNVYEERSLGIYADDPAMSDELQQQRKGKLSGILKGRWTGQPTYESRGYFVRQQLRAQLAHDVWWIVLAVFLIMIVESSQFEREPVSFSVFNIIFEVVSAYGCVGISLGVPDDNYSFSGSWRLLSKLILCAVMLRGRHRGLPVAIDKAVMLPSDMQNLAEEEDARIRIERTMSHRGLV